MWPEIRITKLKYEVSVGPTVVGNSVTSTSVDYYILLKLKPLLVIKLLLKLLAMEITITKTKTQLQPDKLLKLTLKHKFSKINNYN